MIDGLRRGDAVEVLVENTWRLASVTEPSTDGQIWWVFVEGLTNEIVVGRDRLRPASPRT